MTYHVAVYQPMIKHLSKLLPYLALLVLTACQQQAPRPDAQWIEHLVTTKDQFHHLPDQTDLKMAKATETLKTTPKAEQSFWHSLQDKTLQNFLSAANKHNQDLALAVKNLELSQWVLKDRKIDQLPQASNSATLLNKADSSNQAFPPNNHGQSYQDHAVVQSIDWEIDFFGRLKNQNLAAIADVRAQENELAHAKILVRSSVAEQYYLTIGLRAQIKALKENLSHQSETLKLINAQLQSGIATPLDAARAKSQFYASKAKLLPLLTQESQANTKLARLTGLPIESIEQSLSKVTNMPLLPDIRPQIPTPEQILFQRPDILAAKARAEQAYATIGQAHALKYPRISFITDIGLTSDDSGKLIEGDSLFHALGFRISWAGLGMKRVNNLIYRNTTMAHLANLQYQQTILNAFEQIENALVEYENTRQNLHYLDISAAAAKTASLLAKEQYEGGIISFLEVLEAEQQRLELETELASAGTTQSLAGISLIRKLALQ